MKPKLTDNELDAILATHEIQVRQWREAKIAQGLPTHDMGLDIELTPWLVDKVRARPVYAQNLYAAMCNRDWQEQAVWPILKDETWSCSWRSAGGLIAELRGEGDYMDWYCSGMQDMPGYVAESHVTDEIRQDLALIGWRPLDSQS
jgi:hypothetical protein